MNAVAKFHPRLHLGGSALLVEVGLRMSVSDGRAPSMPWLLIAEGASTDADAFYREGKHEKALAIWRSLADEGDASAQNNLGVMHARGEGVARNLAAAVDWIGLSARQDLATAQYNIGFMTAQGAGASRDKPVAAQWMRKAAEQGHAAAQSTLGMLHLLGDGVAEDAAEATRWLLEAANQGEAKAQYLLGSIYEEGLGCDVDLTRAFKWYRQAALQNHRQAAEKLLELCARNPALRIPASDLLDRN